MELTPQSVRTTAFKTVKKGYDPTEVDSFKTQVASAIETAQNQATAMEARARAAVSKLQELTQAGATKDPGSSTPASGTPAAGSPVAAPAAAPAPSAADLTSADAESISRTLLLAQRTADATVADAQREADGIAAAAEAEASSILEAARANATKLVDDARIEGRRANDEERVRAEGEVQALLARRDFLVSDVDHLELHVGAQRERLRDAASALQDLVDRVPAGLGEIRRPLLSASDTSDSSDAASMAAVGDGDGDATVAAELPLSHDEP
ncbi:MAG: hypothetical protein JWM12_3144 [Ilumatobacteraceae bacterium]|nr:hypothetical protein [Ilumatobacteraceae bacterium]